MNNSNVSASSCQHMKMRRHDMALASGDDRGTSMHDMRRLPDCVKSKWG